MSALRNETTAELARRLDTIEQTVSMEPATLRAVICELAAIAGELAHRMRRVNDSICAIAAQVEELQSRRGGAA